MLGDLRVDQLTHPSWAGLFHVTYHRVRSFPIKHPVLPLPHHHLELCFTSSIFYFLSFHLLLFSPLLHLFHPPSIPSLIISLHHHHLTLATHFSPIGWRRLTAPVRCPSLALWPLGSLTFTIFRHSFPSSLPHCGAISLILEV